jgi:hypothetical protein
MHVLVRRGFQVATDSYGARVFMIPAGNVDIIKQVRRCLANNPRCNSNLRCNRP